jgi:signal transduction histidine kinase
MLRLTVLEGKDKSEIFVSREAPVSIGTASDNEVRLTDPFVSRHHGRLSSTNGRWFYRDLGSSNGSVMERAGVRTALDRQSPEVEVASGDLLLVGQTVLRFEAAEVVQAVAEPTVVATRSLADLLGARERQLASLGGLADAYQFERQIGLAFDPEQTLDVILDMILSGFPQATHAIILLVDKKTKRPRRQVARVRGEEGRAAEEIPVSTSVAGRVVSEGKSLLFKDVPAEFADSQSVVAAGISSSICAPLWTGDETVGLIQVDIRGPKARFTEGDLERLGLIAGRAALAIVGSELREAEHRNRLLQDLSAMITHDLNGPLTSIMGFLDLLSREPLEDRQREFVEIAFSSSKWLSVLIAAILDVAKMEAGQLALEREPLQVAEEIERSLALVSYQLREKDMRLETAAPRDLPPVLGDCELFRRIIVNLVGNAAKFSPRNSALAVSATFEQENKRIVISVQDEGPGISREHQARIFDKFVQVAGAKSAEQVSVGLGLAFCRMAVEAHGGSIWVESEPGRGSRFCFSLPVT